MGVGLVDDNDLELLGESMDEMLAEQCDSLTLHKFYDRANALDETLWGQAAELGWLGIGLPADRDGLDMGLHGLDVLYRALGKAAAPGGFIPTLTTAQWLVQVAQPGLLDELLPAVISGSLAFAAPAAPGGIGLSLSGGVLSGTSPMLLAAKGAAMALVPVDQSGAGALALVRLDDAGVTCEVVDLWDRTRHAITITCDGASPVALFDDPDGTLAARYFAMFGLAIAADSVAAGRRIAQQTVDYLKGREQFGRPLASFQALKHRCANLFIALTPADNLLRHAVAEMAAGSPGALMWAALAKAGASEAFRFVASDCVQLHGGVGHTWEYDCHIFLKRALLNESLAGRNNDLRDLAADELDTATRKGISLMEFAA